MSHLVACDGCSTLVSDAGVMEDPLRLWWTLEQGAVSLGSPWEGRVDTDEEIAPTRHFCSLPCCANWLSLHPEITGERTP